MIPAVLVSLGRAFGINIDKYANKYGRQVDSEVEDQCIGSFNGNYPGLRVQHLLKKKYRAFLKIPKIARTVNKLIMGSTPGRPQMPMFMGVGNADGTGDDVMIAKDVRGARPPVLRRGAARAVHGLRGRRPHRGRAPVLPARRCSSSASGSRGRRSPATAREIGPGNSLAPLKVKEEAQAPPRTAAPAPATD